MNKSAILILLFTSVAQAQIVVEERQLHVAKFQNFVPCPTCTASYWDAKRAPETQRPIAVFSVPVYTVIPTAPVTQPLPGQTAEQRRQMDQMSR